MSLIAFKQMLENKDKDPAAITAFIDRAALKQKYPLGFALFYSDTQTTPLYYISPISVGVSAKLSSISFDPSLLKINRTGENTYCISMLPIRERGYPLVANYCGYAPQIAPPHD